MQPSTVPKFRVNGIEKAEKKGNSRTERHERVHIGLTMASLFPGVDEKTSAKQRQYGHGQHQHYPIGVGHIHEKHANHHHRCRQNTCPNHVVLERFYVCCFEFGLFDLGIFGV